MAISIVILPACASVSKIEPPQSVQVQTKFICPDELKGNISELPKIPDGARLDGPPLGQKWLSDLQFTALEYYQRLKDAQRQCETQ